MSYEGWRQKLCKKGHLDVEDAYDKSDDPCPLCGEPWVWTHEVDDTNCDGEEHPLEVATPAKVCTCSDCGNQHIVEAPTYKIPQDAGLLRPSGE